MDANKKRAAEQMAQPRSKKPKISTDDDATQYPSSKPKPTISVAGLFAKKTQPQREDENHTSSATHKHAHSKAPEDDEIARIKQHPAYIQVKGKRTPSDPITKSLTSNIRQKNTTANPPFAPQKQRKPTTRTKPPRCPPASLAPKRNSCPTSRAPPQTTTNRTLRQRTQAFLPQPPSPAPCKPTPPSSAP